MVDLGTEPSGGLVAPGPLAASAQARRRRRPTGAPPPLPRSLGTTGKIWLVLAVLLLGWVLAAFNFEAVRRAADRTDSALLEQIARLRTPWLTDTMAGIDRVGTGWTLVAVAGGMVVLLVVFRRWRHLIILLASLMVLELVVGRLYDGFARPRPYGVTIIGRWSGFTLPSPPVAFFAAVVVGILYTLVVPGRSRSIAKWVAALVVAAFVLARLYLAVDHPTDVVVAVALGVAIPLTLFRLFTPNELFPVAYRQGKTAHLDVAGRRGEAIRRAVEDQLGVTVVDIKHVGLEGSGGSTPLRLEVEGGPTRYLFAKLYAMNHVRADRWYKLGRLLLYGRLEDERSYPDVRRLVEYEDYAARVFRDAGIPTAASYGVVELTPDREYLLVTEFFDGADEIGDVEVDDQVIDEGLTIVRRLWDAGLAHRDIKPANLLVRDGHVLLIDVAFTQIRPSPWRQAVDLANMMLVLAVRTDAERVYLRALRYFAPADIAEAFAAARGVASPSQLRLAMKRDGRDLIGELRELAPPHRPITLQRWSLRRVGLAAAIVLAGAFGLSQVATRLSPSFDIPLDRRPDCGTDDAMVLIAQSVPTATSVPCVGTLPAGWRHGGVRVRRHRTVFWLDSDRAGDRAVEVTLERHSECDVSDAVRVPSDELGAIRYERPERLPPTLRSTRIYLFSGGCVTYRFAFGEDATPVLSFEADQALAFQPREELAAEVRADTDLALCGAGEPCPG
jgi:serine/threonine protein kinase